MTKKELLEMLADVKDEDKIEIIGVSGTPFSFDGERMVIRKLTNREFKLCIK